MFTQNIMQLVDDILPNLKKKIVISDKLFFTPVVINGETRARMHILSNIFC